ncbi:MAG: HPP family protein [Gammaproteobacteria bacterium]|nr:HPP family protein [Gammaproteobacteria bacterium]
MRHYLARMKSKEPSPARIPLIKILWSWLGAFIGIYLITSIGNSFTGDATINLFLIGSFGASAMLVYGAPLAEFSQPRNLVGGHIICALIGTACYKYIHLDLAMVTAIAASTSIVIMHFTRTMHPPGGATAMIAVIGNTQVHDLGYWFALSPVGLGTIILLIVAVMVNNLSVNPKRHYPRYWL